VYRIPLVLYKAGVAGVPIASGLLRPGLAIASSALPGHREHVASDIRIVGQRFKIAFMHNIDNK